MINEQFCSYYLENRNIAFANEPPASVNEKNLQDAVNITMSTSGMNPMHLAQYPNLITKITTVLSRSTGIKNIESTFMKNLVNFYQKTNSIANYVEELLSSNKREDILLARRILNQLQEIEECAICYTNTSSTFFQCGHRVCSTCSNSLNKCPFCRTSITTLLEKLEEKEKETEKPKNLPRFRLIEGDILKFIESRITGLIKRSSTLDDKTATEISKLIEFYPNEILSIVKKSISSIKAEEILCFVSGKLFYSLVLGRNISHSKWNPSQIEISEFIAKRITSPSRVIRFLTSISTNEAVKDKPVKIKISNPFRRFLIAIINQFELSKAETEIKQRKGFWVWLFKHLHIRDSKWKMYEKAQDLGNFTRGNRKAVTKPIMNEFNQLYSKSSDQLLDFFIQYPGLCFRFFRCSLLKLQNKIKKEQWTDFLSKLLPKMKAVQIVELLHILQMVPSLQGEIVYRIKNGQFYWPKTNYTSVIDAKLLEVTIEAVRSSIKHVPYRLLVDTTYPLQYLRLAKGRPPKVPEWVPQVCATGDIIKIHPDDQVILFVHWMNGKSVVDLDLSVMCIGSDSKMLGKVDYTNLQGCNNTIEHSGDYTYAPPPNGSSEYITFVPSKVVKASPAIQELYVLCFSFNGVPFDQMGQAFVGIGVIDKAKQGLGPEGSNVIAGCELSGSCEVNFTSKYNFKTHELTFVNTNITSKRGSYSIRSASRQVSGVSKKFLRWLQTRSPASFDKVKDTFLLGAKEVQLINGRTSKFFKIREKESGVEFQKRVLAGRDEDKQEPDPKLKVCYFGNTDSLSDEMTKEWPSNSLVIAKGDPKCAPNVVWATDPYAVYN